MEWIEKMPWLMAEPNAAGSIPIADLLEWLSKNVVLIHGIEPGERELQADRLIAQSGRINLANGMLAKFQVIEIPKPERTTGEQLRNFTEAKDVTDEQRSTGSTTRRKTAGEEIPEGTKSG